MVSNRIVGYSISDRMKSRIVVDAVSMAVARRGDVSGCSDRLNTASTGLARSDDSCTTMAWSAQWAEWGRASDNAAMESFFALLQNNVLDRQPWSSREQLRIAIVLWIERTYHRRGRQAALGRLTPVQFEAIMTTPAAIAA